MEADTVTGVATAVDRTLLLGARTPTFTTSASIAKIVAALAAAQAEIVQPTKSADNPFFKSKYAPLDVVWEAARMALSKHGVAVIQSPTYEVTDIATDTKTKKVGIVTLVTMLAHTSGEWFKGVHFAVAENIGPQGAQAALTYARRAALGAMVMVTPQAEDDDAEDATDHGGKIPSQQIDAYSKGLSAAAKVGSIALKDAWEVLPPEAKVLMQTLKDALKGVAAKADKAQKPEPHPERVEEHGS